MAADGLGANERRMVAEFVVFEGPEGSGKSTQIARLHARLAARGVASLTTREPGGTPAGDAIRRLLLDEDVDIEPLTEFLLYAASRAQHTSDVIRPALCDGKIVICDRYTGASVAYQGYGRGLDVGHIRSINELATGGLRADVTVLLDIDPEIGLLRVAARGHKDRLESADLAFHQRVRQGFLTQAREEDWIVLDGTLPEEALDLQIWDALEPVLAP